MDITKGSLDDISRPASSERSRAGSRVSSVSLSEVGKVSQDRPRSLEVLSPEVSETQDRWSEQDNNSDCMSENVPPGQDVSDEENEDPELLKAIRKMKRLDRILAMRISNEKEVKKQGRELHQKLWQELEDLKTERTAECSDEAENTRLFLALTSSTSKGCSEEVDFTPVFGTQVPDEENDLSLRLGNEEVEVHSESSGSVEGGQEVRRDKQTDSRQTLNGKSKHRQDFVKKNIELAGGAGSLILVTQEEKERLEELLKDLEEEEAHVEPLNNPQANVSLCTVPTTSGEGYTPQPDELDQLLHIDARLQLLLPVENFLSVKSPYTDRSLTQCGLHGSDGERVEERPPGERVLRDMKESRGQEERLREIQQQLHLLGHSQQTTSLPEDQLRSLLVECEMALSRCSGSGTEDSSPRPYCALESHAMSLLASTPRLSSSAISELLQEACGTPSTPHESEEATLD
ncbi:fibrous sheath-interacting protein 1 isoform X1 [Colossoma macropomum]|uniref:fibrous sheath-interacting protein 1 isoform X1 n=1 Tax=Colossoma macropomum TaxID=42526 RepID=UPI0018648CCF|nr:fibrous sheath-interacting protein 1 isoform X1 [Colossoma macropomum]XP_036449405.1 fibrous sheath-interacting protein 1 isoform X1 [Colossoma macropomum]